MNNTKQIESKLKIDQRNQKQYYLELPNPNILTFQSPLLQAQEAVQRSNLVQVPIATSHYFQSGIASNLFPKIKSLISQLVTQNQENKTPTYQAPSLNLEQTKQIMSLTNELTYYKQLHQQSLEQVASVEQTFTQSLKQQKNAHRKQIQKYMQLLTEKEKQLEKKKKECNALQEKIKEIGYEMQKIGREKRDIQSGIGKGIEGLKAMIREIGLDVGESELNRVMLQGKYRQICEKIEQILKANLESQNERSRIEKKWNRMKENFQQLRNQNLKLKFQIQKHKIKLQEKTQRQKITQLTCLKSNPKQITVTQQVLQGLTSNCQELVKNLENLTKKQQSLELQSLKTLNNTICQLTKQNRKIKAQLEQKSFIIDQMRLKYQGSKYQEQMMKQRNPSLFQILNEKKRNIENLQKKIQQLQEKALKAQLSIQQKLLAYKKQQQIRIQIIKSQLLTELDLQINTYKQKTAALALCLQKQQQKYNQLLREKTQTSNQFVQLQHANQNLKKKLQNSLSILAQSRKSKKLMTQQRSSQQEDLEHENMPNNQTNNNANNNNNKGRKKVKTKAKIKCQQCTAQIGNKGIKCQRCEQKLCGGCWGRHNCKL